MVLQFVAFCKETPLSAKINLLKYSTIRIFRRTHNPKVVSSSLAPATKQKLSEKSGSFFVFGLFRSLLQEMSINEKVSAAKSFC